MIKNVLVFLIFVSAFALWGKAIQAQFGSLDVQQSNAPVVVELFTSQSCSSCPPADQVLEDLTDQDNIIALSCHVTYWDHLHWKDTLGRDFCTQRQRQFAGENGSGRVYTPQMVVNGEDEFVGSRRRQAAASINRATRTAKVKPINIQNGENGVEAKLPALESGSYALWVFGYKKAHKQDIPSGENRGKTVHYANAAQYQKFAGHWDGQGKTLNIDIPESENIEGVIILAQSPKYGPITAAGQLDF